MYPRAPPGLSGVGACNRPASIFERGAPARPLDKENSTCVDFCANPGPSNPTQPGTAQKETDMWAMVVKEFRQLRRDRRTLAMMIVLPILLLVVFGYAASFDVKTIPTKVVGPNAATAAGLLKAPFDVISVDP